MADINSASIAIAITTHYPKWYQGKLRSIKHTEKIRGDLALEFITFAQKKGYKVVVVDGKSTKTFFKSLPKKENVFLMRRLGDKRAIARRQAIKKASKLPGVKAILVIEPEKISLLTDSIDALVKALLENTADIVVPKRDQALFKESYPSYMYESEIEANTFYNETLRANGLLFTNNEDFDMFFGPRLFRNSNEIVRLFMQKYLISSTNISFPKEYFDTEQYSNVLFFPIVFALKKKLRVISISIPFVYPQLQKRNEEKGARELFLEKRKSQRLGILVELLHFISYLNNNINSRVKKE